MPLDISNSMVELIEDYYWQMALRHRLLSLSAGSTLLGLVTFFVLPSLQEVPRYHQRKPLTVLDDLPDGPVLYLDYLSTYRWSPRLATLIEQELTQRVPSWEIATWFRPTDTVDRQFIYTRRR